MKKKPNYILALDIGGTKLAAGVFDGGYNLVGHVRVPTHVEEGPDAVFERITRLLESLMEQRKISSRDLCCIGVGCGGPLDAETGVIYSPPNLPGWDAYPLKGKLETHFGVRAFIDNDANAAGMAEQRFGAGRGYNNIFYITASTGIGSGIILDGKLYGGTNYSAGEFGHIVLARNGPKCNCGGRGCLEALASGPAIARRARKEAERAPGSRLAKMLNRKQARFAARDVIALARRGDRLSQRIFDDAVFYLGLGIVSAIHLLNPEIVIIGGGLSQTGRFLFEPLRQIVVERAQKHLANFVRIVPAELGSKVGVYGALAVALDRQPS